MLNEPVRYDKRRYRRCTRFGSLEDWRGVAARYDRYPTVFFSLIVLAAAVIFLL